MTERDRVLDAFRNCISEPKCKDCPWTECETIGNSTIEIPRDLALAVMRELVAQTPRLMTLEEIGNALKMPIWKETKGAHKDLYAGWVLAYDIQKGAGITRLGMYEPSRRVVWYRLDDYGKTWRCWTDRPTYEQMKEAPWQD